MPPSSALRSFADDLWIDDASVRILGMPLTTTMTVLRVADGLLVHSPIALTPERRAAVEALGPVRHLYAPNTFHHLWLGEWAAAFPDARVHAPPGLVAKRPDLRLDRTDGTPEPGFAGVVDEVTIAGFALEERVLVHRPSGTLVVGDLVHNIGRPDDLWTRVYAGAMGFYGRVAMSRLIRLAAFTDRAAARGSLDTVLALPFDRMVVGHGAPIEAGARDVLAAAHDWLPPRPAAIPRQEGAGLSLPSPKPCG